MVKDHASTRRELLFGGAVLFLAGPRLWNERQAGPLVTGDKVKGLESFDELMGGFLVEHDVPGAALAVSREGRLVYARGFGFADVEAREPTAPNALFRIASVSKPLTAVGIMRLVDRSKLKLDDKALEHIDLAPHLEPGENMDPRWRAITIRHLLQHTGGWDRSVSFDPIVKTREIAAALDVKHPVSPAAIVRYMMGKPLDFDPGARYAYSNLGYLVLGRIIEKLSKEPYDSYVRKSVLEPLDVRRPILGKALLEDRAPGEVRYYSTFDTRGVALFGPNAGEEVPVQYGHDNLQGYEAHGGWIASAPDLVKFACDFDGPSKLLKKPTVQEMFARPTGVAGTEPNGTPRDSFYGCGWSVRPTRDGKENTWHEGYIVGTSSLLVRRSDGLNWAVLFNTDHSRTRKKLLAALIDRDIHVAADKVKSWPKSDSFSRYLKTI